MGDRCRGYGNRQGIEHMEPGFVSRPQAKRGSLRTFRNEFAQLPEPSVHKRLGHFELRRTWIPDGALADRGRRQFQYLKPESNGSLPKFVGDHIE